MGNKNFTHPFDGFAKLYSFKIVPGKPMLFSTKFVQTSFYNKSSTENEVAPFLLFDTVEPPFTELQEMEQFWNGIDNPNINVYKLGDSRSQNRSQFVAMSDFWEIYQFDPNSLETKTKIKARVPGQVLPLYKMMPLPSSSHPVREFGTDNYINYVTLINPLPFGKSTIKIVRIKSATERKLIAKIKVSKIPYMHSFALSRNYVILFASPLYINVYKMLKTAKPFQSLEWHKEEKSRLYVVDLRNGQVTKLTTETVFAMHHVNAFEINSTTIAMDVVTYPDISMFSNLEMAKLKNKTIRDKGNTPATLKRYFVNLGTKQVTVTKFLNNSSAPITPNMNTSIANKLDMPAINEKYRHKKYCYVYGFIMQSDEKHVSAVSLTKKNVCGGKDLVWFQENHYPLEPWFVGPPGGQEEDAGVLLSLVLDGEKKKSYVAVLNARNMKTINRCYLDTPIPFTLHGRFFPDA